MLERLRNEQPIPSNPSSGEEVMLHHVVEYGDEDLSTQEGSRNRFNRLAGELGLGETGTQQLVSRLQRGESTEDDRHLKGFDALSKAWEELDELSDHD